MITTTCVAVDLEREVKSGHSVHLYLNSNTFRSHLNEAIAAAGEKRLRRPGYGVRGHGVSGDQSEEQQSGALQSSKDSKESKDSSKGRPPHPPRTTGEGTEGGSECKEGGSEGLDGAEIIQALGLSRL